MIWESALMQGIKVQKDSSNKIDKYINKWKKKGTIEKIKPKEFVTSPFISCHFDVPGVYPQPLREPGWQLFSVQE